MNVGQLISGREGSLTKSHKEEAEPGNKQAELSLASILMSQSFLDLVSESPGEIGLL